MSSTLYINGLYTSVGEPELTGMCAQLGSVSSVNICKPDTVLSSGMARGNGGHRVSHEGRYGVPSILCEWKPVVLLPTKTNHQSLGIRSLDRSA